MDPELAAFSTPSIPGSHDLFQAPLLLLNQDLGIDRLGAHGTDIAPRGFVEVRLANLPAVWTSDDKRFFFFGLWHGIMGLRWIRCGVRSYLLTLTRMVLELDFTVSGRKS